jgi:hypothetical protein
VYLNALHHEADVVRFSILVEIYNNNNNNNKAIIGVLPPTPKFVIFFLEEQPPPTWRNLVFKISICYIIITIMLTVCGPTSPQYGAGSLQA